MAKEWILGQQLGHFVGHGVLVMGIAEHVDTAGRVLRVRSTDDLLITVHLEDLLAEKIAPGSHVEVSGYVRSRSEIEHAAIVDFPETTQLEPRVVNEAIHLFQENLNEIEREIPGGD